MSRQLWLVFIGVVIAAVFAVQAGEYSLWQSLSLNRERAAERANIADLRRQVDSLARMARLVETDLETQERIAREHYGLLKPGEHAYILVEPSQP